MKAYETGFLVAPNITEDETEAIIQQMAEVISQKNGKMTKLDRWGKRRTAFPLKKFHEATYVFFQYEGEPDVPAELGRRFRQMDTILRHLTLVRETRPNVRRKKAAGRARARESGPEGSADTASAGAEAATAKKSEEA